MVDRVDAWRARDGSNGRAARAVIRPGPFGNPFTIAECRRLLADGAILVHPADPGGALATEAIAQSLYENALRTDRTLLARVVAELAGLNLACTCPLTDEAGRYRPCHADVLRRAANEPAALWMGHREFDRRRRGRARRPIPAGEASHG